MVSTGLLMKPILQVHFSCSVPMTQSLQGTLSSQEDSKTHKLDWSLLAPKKLKAKHIWSTLQIVEHSSHVVLATLSIRLFSLMSHLCPSWKQETEGRQEAWPKNMQMMRTNIAGPAGDWTWHYLKPAYLPTMYICTLVTAMKWALTLYMIKKLRNYCSLNYQGIIFTERLTRDWQG